MAFGAFKDFGNGSGISIASTNNADTQDQLLSASVGDLIYAVFIEQTSLTVTAATDNLGNTYTAVNAGTDAGAVTARAFYSRVTVSGLLTDINFAATASSNNWVAVVVLLEGPIAGLDSNPANITSDITSPFSCPPTGVLTQADEIVIAWGAANYVVDWLATSPMTLRIKESSSTLIEGSLASKVVTATTTTTPAFTAASNPTQAILGTTTFRKTLPVETITVTQATVTLTGKTVTVLNTEKVTVTQASVTLTGKTVTVRETDLIPVAKASVTLTGQTVTIADFIVERITVDASAVLFTGKTVDLVEIVGGSLDLDFINDPSIASKVTCVRAGTANMDNYAGTWSAVAANTPRISDKGLLVETTRTNRVINNSWQGAVAGTPGTMPTSWTLSLVSGLSRQIVGVGTENGVDYIDIRVSGVAASTGPSAMGDIGFASAAGQTWVTSGWIKLVAGSLANLSSFTLRCAAEAGGTAFTPDSTWRRITNTRTLTGTVAQWALRWNNLDTVNSVDFTLRIGWPQEEASASPTSPIRTTTAAVTRAADIVTVNSPPAINAVAGGMFSEHVFPYDALVASSLYTFQIDDGTTNNRIGLLASTGTDLNQVIIVAGGVTQTIGLNVGVTYSYGTVTRSAMRYAANDVAFSNDGLGPAFDTVVTLPTGMNRFGIGSTATGAVNTFAYIRHVKYFDDPPTDAELVEMTTAPVELVGVDHGFLEFTGQPVTPTDVLPVTNAAIVFAGKTVTVLETSSVVVAKATVTITGKTVTIRDDTVIAVDRALVALTGKPITIISALPVTKATVTFAGKTVTVVTSTFQDIPKYIIRGRGSRHDLWTNGFGGTIKGRGSRTFLVMR